MSFQSIITSLASGAINIFIPLIITLATVYFVYGLVKYLFAGGSGDKRQEAVGFMVRGIIALFIMVSVWALVGLFSVLLGSSVGIPQF